MVQYGLMTIIDYESVQKLWRKTPGMGLNAIDDSKEGLERYLRRNPTTCFVAKKEGRVVGSILSGHDGRRGHIYHLAVEVDERHQGIGSELVRLSLESLRLEGIFKVSFAVFRDNAVGNAFWEHLHFDERTDLVYRNKVITDAKMGWCKIG
ncbi:MAG: GNAT family N-acetyltransferase [Sphaerochaetaceae bacterium]